MIKTTINISNKTLKKLENASSKLNMSIIDVIKLLMMNIHQENKNNNKYLNFYSIIKYQKRNPEIIWSCMHITLTPSEYEHFIDMRNFFKKSVSNIIAFAAIKYLKILLKKHNKPKLKDNNPTVYFSIYNFYVDFFKGVKSYIISNEKLKEYP